MYNVRTKLCLCRLYYRVYGWCRWIHIRTHSVSIWHRRQQQSSANQSNSHRKIAFHFHLSMICTKCFRILISSSFQVFFSSLSSFSFCTRLPRLPLLLCVITVYAHYVLRFHSFTQRLFLASTNKKRIIIICFSLFFVLEMQYTRVHCSYLSKRGSIQSNQIELIIVRFVAKSWYKFNIKLCVHST